MIENESHYRLRPWLLALRTAGFGSLALLAVACGNNNGEATEPTTAVTAVSPSTSGQAARLVFDDLGVGSAYIYVYPGIGEDAADSVPAGQFPSGESVEATCQTNGRSVAELDVTPPVHSNVWYGFELNGTTVYATDVYAVDSPDLQALPEC